MNKQIILTWGTKTWRRHWYRQQDYLQGAILITAFPDGESFIQVESDCTDKQAIIVANLHHPDDKLLPLAF